MAEKKMLTSKKEGFCTSKLKLKVVHNMGTSVCLFWGDNFYLDRQLTRIFKNLMFYEDKRYPNSYRTLSIPSSTCSLMYNIAKFST